MSDFTRYEILNELLRRADLDHRNRQDALTRVSDEELREELGKLSGNTRDKEEK